VRCGEVWVIGVGQLVWVGRSGSDGRSEAGWVGRRRSRSGELLYDICNDVHIAYTIYYILFPLPSPFSIPLLPYPVPSSHPLLLPPSVSPSPSTTKLTHDGKDGPHT